MAIEAQHKIGLVIAFILCFTSSFSQETVPIKEYIDMQVKLNVEWSQRYNDAQLASLKEANELVRISLQEYKTINNEWRGQLKDQAATFVTRGELILAVTTLIGVFFAFQRYQNEKNDSKGKNIVSGDKVEVKK